MTWYTRLWKFITLAHGAGGKETEELVENLIVQRVPPELWRVGEGGAGLDALDDSAIIPLGDGRYLAVTVDSYTVKPIFFPGGDLGKLAASGTINDLLMAGARPVAALDAMVVEEGFPIEDFNKIVESYIGVLRENRVALIGGDFKTMPKDQLDGIVISSIGIGFTEHPIIDSNIKPGDKIIASGYLGDHGAAILAAQQAVGVDLGVKSDVKPLTDLMLPLLDKYADKIHGAGDPTRGGLAMLANDWARKTNTVIVLYEERIPIRPQVKEYAEMLGVDPLSLASEGAAVLAVDPEHAEEIVEEMRRLGYREAEIIGEVFKPRDPRHAGRVLLKSTTGGVRILEPPSGEIVPRIC